VDDHPRDVLLDHDIGESRVPSSVNKRLLPSRVTPLLLSLALISTACSTDSAAGEQPSDVTFRGVDGVVSDVSDTSRIITLSGDITEFVYKLGAGDAVVATDLTTVHPEAAVSLPKIGIGRFLTAEAVLKHDPSLVIGDTQTSPLSAIDQIRAAGVPVVILDVSTTFDIMYTKIDALGAILDVGEIASALRSDLRAEINAAGKGLAASAVPPSVAYVYTRGPDVMLLFGSGMVTHPVIEAAGAIDAGAAAGVEGSIPVTPEALIAAAPDVIIVPEEGLEMLGGIEGLLSVPGIAQTPAGLEGQILGYPEGDFLTLGPRIARSIETLTLDLVVLNSTP
jgi:iron complex transport system substrate-binding protein